MYVLKTYHLANPKTIHLLEMTPSEFRLRQSVPDESITYRRIQARDAYKHIKKGRPHSTALYLNAYGEIMKEDYSS